MTTATLSTELGDIEVDLFTTAAPKATQNFIDLAKKGYYDDVIFHRVIPGFVAQAGDGEHGKKASLNAGRVGTGGAGSTLSPQPRPRDHRPGGLALGKARPHTQGTPVFILLAPRSRRLP